MTYELKPMHTNQKSFYGKARVTVSYYNGAVTRFVLESYGTEVAMVRIDKCGMAYVRRLWSGYSATTMRHVNEFIMQEGFPKMSARVWRAMELGKFYAAGDITTLEKSLK